MNITIKPSQAKGTVTAPPSKSMAHRLLICGALARGETRVENLAWSNDILATLDCLRALGAVLNRESNAVTVEGGLPEQDGPVVLPCRESGSTLRFLLPLALVRDREVTFTGSPTLLSRPLGVYDQLCLNQGIRFEKSEDRLTVQGKLKPGAYEIPGDVSSQFATGLLLALPLLEGPSDLELVPPVESRSYIELTLAALRDFGVRIIRVGDNKFHIPGRQKLRPHRCAVEGDWSNAAFLEALNLMGSDLKVKGLSDLSVQGDKVYRACFKALQGGKAQLDLSDCPDLGPILFALAAHLGGGVFTGTGRLRYKESDRCAAMAQELEKLGAQLVVEDDHVWVGASMLHAPTEPLWCHNDHRIAMALGVLLTYYGGTLTGAECVAKSYPEFFEVLRRLGIDLEEQKEEQQEEAP